MKTARPVLGPRIAMFAVLAAFSASLLAQETTDNRPFDEPFEREQIQAFFARFSEESTKEEPSTDAFIDISKIVDEFIDGLPRKPNIVRRFVLRLSLNRKLEETLSANLLQGQTRFQVRTVELSGDGDTAEVIIRTVDDETLVSHYRCWMEQDLEMGWRINDWEDLGTAFRLTTMMAMLASQFNEDDAAEMATSMRLLQQTGEAVFEGDFEGAHDLIRQLDGMKLPEAIEAYRWVIAGSVHLGLEYPDEALKAFAKAESYQEDIAILDYLRAIAYNLLERHEDALVSARAFLARIGDDPDAYYEMGEALQALGRTEEAFEAYRKGLDDIPDSLDNLVALGLLLPKKRKDEIAQRFEQLSKPVRDFEPLAVEFQMAEDPDALDSLVAAFRRIAPDDPNNLYYGAVSKALREQYVEAAKMLPHAFDRVEDETERQAYVELYLDCWLEANKPLEGYKGAPDKQWALDYLTENLVWDELYAEAGSLIDHHEKAHPKDPLPHYLRGDLLFQQDEWEKADRAYARGQKLPMDEEQQEDFRFSRIFCWYMQGKGLEAYGKFEPNDRTFSDLADLFIDDQDGKQLQKLVAAHEAQVGETADTAGPAIMAAWFLDDYATTVTRFSQHREVLEEMEGEGAYEDVVIRSLVRLGRFKEALRAAGRSTKRDDDPFFEVVVYAAFNKTYSCRKAIDACLDLDYYVPEDLLEDPDIGPALKREAFVDLFERLSAQQAEQTEE
jgi:tetratricopeptide (TPR) repeat protein